ncbi:sodium/solute symporter [Streptomyces sp. HUAS TT20]|uniref:sodium/solute symporter n=1 Tax=Streptomyces sp. HUAS TT20 TaxID=3447509 RepID=UPI0021D934B1|nr:cation acetate symporter [Streptomyces sp. HUAS 15-9]UXY32035.1 cation acetate symporter [Streptomyces sp. HUAS 15-9]
MNAPENLAAVLLVVAVTVAVGGYGLKSRSTPDFYVASRTVSPLRNAAAVSGEYLSAASYLGIAGLLVAYGSTMLWYSIGYTAGYLVLLVLVAAPLRRSGAYTVSDFAEARLDSLAVRRTATAFVVLIGWFYQVPQLQGAGLVLHATLGAPAWSGALLVTAVVLVGMVTGGMRSVTLVQAVQFWLKLAALAIPAIVLLLVWRGVWHPSGGPAATSAPAAPGPTAHAGSPWAAITQGGGRGLYSLYSLMVATFLGAMGMPHVIARFYTNPDGRAARRTTVGVLGLLGLFYLLPEVYGGLGRLFAPGLAQANRADTVVLLLPGRLVPGAAGQLLTALVVAGAFAAFLSTCSGLALSVAAVLSQDLLGGDVRGFRRASAVAVLTPCGIALLLSQSGVSVAHEVGLIFSVAASTFCPLLVLGIWWRGLTAPGAVAGMLVGGGLSAAAVMGTLLGAGGLGWAGTLLAQPAAWSVPAAVLTMVGVSLATRGRVPAGASVMLARLHLPEALAAETTDRSAVEGDRSSPDHGRPSRHGHH